MRCVLAQTLKARNFLIDYFDTTQASLLYPLFLRAGSICMTSDNSDGIMTTGYTAFSLVYLDDLPYTRVMLDKLLPWTERLHFKHLHERK